MLSKPEPAFSWNPAPPVSKPRRFTSWHQIQLDAARQIRNTVLGYDNAHAVKPPKKFKYAGQRLPFDHRHRTSSDKGVPYAFESAYRLLEDFFAEVDRVIKEAQE
jgi:hypothetical protein